MNNLLHEQNILAGVRVILRQSVKRLNIIMPIGMSTEAMLQYAIEWEAPVRETIHDWNSAAAQSQKLNPKQFELMLEMSQRCAVIYEAGIKALRGIR